MIPFFIVEHVMGEPLCTESREKVRARSEDPMIPPTDAAEPYQKLEYK